MARNMQKNCCEIKVIIKVHLVGFNSNSFERELVV